MSEIINNREYRQKILKQLITELHNGASVEEIKPRFEKLIQGVSVKEITEMEQALIMEGMPVEEIQNLCDVHAAVFKGSIQEIHQPRKNEEIPGHPVHTFKSENEAVKKLIEEKIKPLLHQYNSSSNTDVTNRLMIEINRLWELDKHYSRKENLIFPYLEKYGITAPPKVMWGVDDEIRQAIKDVKKRLAHGDDKTIIESKINDLCDKVIEMIFKEENILLPMVMETLSEDELYKIAYESREIGYTLIEPQMQWKPANVNMEDELSDEVHASDEKQHIRFDAGVLSPEEINSIMNTIPIDVTFVDKNGLVKYFTQGKERIFARPKTIIGRHVKNCHPPSSVHIVEQIVEDLQSGKKDWEDFWIKMGDKYVYIRYFSVRNKEGDFLGIMEVTQDIKPIQDITGEKRLMSSSN